MTRRTVVSLLVLLSLTQSIRAEETPLQVELDTSEVPYLQTWGDDAKSLILKWHPRIVNLLPTENITPPRSIALKIEKSDRGVGGTAGTRITISSHWIEKHPDDLGLIIHELVHVIQSYPSPEPWWVTEGIADYLRWAIYEGKELEWFPRPQEEQGYKRGYRVAAGFLLWLESGPAPGIVKKLNTAMRKGEYSDDIFHAETGRSLDDLWKAYVARR